MCVPNFLSRNSIRFSLYIQTWAFIRPLKLSLIKLCTHIIKITCFANTVSTTELEGKLP